MFFKNLFSSSKKNNAIHVLSASEFRKALSKKDLQLLDVRTPREYAIACIKGAKNINIFEPNNFKKVAARLNKEAPVYLYCQSGKRSRQASKLLVKMGFNHIYDLKGGFSNWH